MKISNKYRNLFKMVLLLFIIVSSTYVLFVTTSENKNKTLKKYNKKTNN